MYLYIFTLFFINMYTGSLYLCMFTLSFKFVRSSSQVLVLDCLHYGKHFSHFGLDEAITAARAIRPRRVLLGGNLNSQTPASPHLQVYNDGSADF